MALELVRFPAPVEDVEQHVPPAAEGDLVPVPELDAPDAADTHLVEGLVHEVLDRGEHGRNQVGVPSGDEVTRQMDHGRAAVVGQVDVFDHAAERVRPAESGCDPGSYARPRPLRREIVLHVRRLGRRAGINPFASGYRG